MAGDLAAGLAVDLAGLAPAATAEPFAALAALAAPAASSSLTSAVPDVAPVPLVVTRWLREVPGRFGALLRDRELAIQLLPWEVGGGWWT